ncbi:MAG: hypothetical protein U1F77_06815 [Kiritimatiellia bacterium]
MKVSIEPRWKKSSVALPLSGESANIEKASEDWANVTELEKHRFRSKFSLETMHFAPIRANAPGMPNLGP